MGEFVQDAVACNKLTLDSHFFFVAMLRESLPAVAKKLDLLLALHQPDLVLSLKGTPGLVPKFWS